MIRRPPTLLVPTRGEIEAAWQAARGNKSEVVLFVDVYFTCFTVFVFRSNLYRLAFFFQIIQ